MPPPFLLPLVASLTDLATALSSFSTTAVFRGSDPASLLAAGPAATVYVSNIRIVMVAVAAQWQQHGSCGTIRESTTPSQHELKTKPVHGLVLSLVLSSPIFSFIPMSSGEKGAVS